ncbi:carotenoid oxygenase family protein [Corynebacterium guangdongense]|uniref:Dioxygenase n=1 Tax=Corynebacterium guangdongense TaxID=1783348 RepID=A0ABU1ZY64_9CORY|nr:carotenoid oxygenase family protein [Corynebacterium guangdongense]MDR7329871.1 carotenoid cleavage dioxygenase [Corynebacterium guangdongense]WJZ18434.1 Lignostilbene-alpha,beta-dioxygenase isozyme III [Corynebacterium guangdongense]
MWATDNKFLNGPFTPWHEETEAFDLEIIGQIPDDLDGALFRTGSNPRFKPRNTDRYHWFEGDGMVYAVYLRDGKAAYRNKYVMTDALKIEMDAGEAIYSGFVNGGTAPALPEGAPPMKNVPNTNVGVLADRLLVFFEGGLPHQMNPETLSTHGTYDFNGEVPYTCTAHYKLDPDTGNMLFYAYQGNHVTWYEADSHGKIVDTFAFDTRAPSMFHDFAVSKNYAIFFVTPSLFLGPNIPQGKPGVVWDPSATDGGVEIVAMHRTTHKVTTFRMEEAFFATHFFNAYEKGSKIIVEAPRMANHFGTPVERLGTPLHSHEWFDDAIPWRWELDTSTGAVTNQPISHIAGEFPQINPKKTGLEHSFGYFVTTRGVAADTMSDGLAKADLKRETVTVIEGLNDLTNPSEPIFVPREGSEDEEAGYLLSIWWNRATKLSELCIYSTEDFTRTPLARIKLPGRVPFGFHGSWSGRDRIEESLQVLAAESKN